MAYSFSFWPCRPEKTLANDYYIGRVQWFHDHTAKGRVALLAESITARGKWETALPGCGVVNRAIEYETTSGALARLDKVLRFKAIISVDMLGANDSLQLKSVLETSARYRAIMHRFAGTSQVIDLSTTLRAGSQTDANARIAGLNRALAGECGSGFCHIEGDALSERYGSGALGNCSDFDVLQHDSGSCFRHRILPGPKVGCRSHGQTIQPS
ncbi:hypothetical protein [Porphyrobacter sp. YT40]|uniref:hypothetical protein n=1 Tax=Porphyrobacter sp. YT40 TaxID=2547601 RepID=UPI001142BF58|nr:hypothetical protein [Porphyrobacter sp. YT40]QDH33907.1 hypothetical protein E2E27_05905 [Porphyrobacter sp. YT40]